MYIFFEGEGFIAKKYIYWHLHILENSRKIAIFFWVYYIQRKKKRREEEKFAP